MTSHTIQHADPTHNHSSKEESKTRKQYKLTADILLLTRVATPSDTLGAPVTVGAHDCAIAGTFITASVGLDAGAVAGTRVCGVDAGVEAVEVLRDHLGERVCDVGGFVGFECCCRVVVDDGGEVG